MNKRGTQDYIKKYARLAVKNASRSVISRDHALGQLAQLHQLALVGIHDRQYAAYVQLIAVEVRERDYAAATDLAEAAWSFPKLPRPKQEGTAAV